MFSYRMIVNRVDHLKIGTRNNWLQGTLNGPCRSMVVVVIVAGVFCNNGCFTLVLFILKELFR